MKKTFADIKKLNPSMDIKIDEPLSRYTYTKTGGNADIMTFPSTYTEIQNILQYTHNHKIPVTILGNGSNVIIRDGGIRGVVVHMDNFNKINCVGEYIIVQSGVSIASVSQLALQQSLTGLEFACGIPGTVGGAVYMNAGAYGGEMQGVISTVTAISLEGQLHFLRKEEIEFGYRKSTFSEKGYIVLAVMLTLTNGVQTEIQKKMDELTFLRESKQPLEFPSCGSVFKRPPNHFAGELIQNAGLQGYQIGGVQVSTKHAGFMINKENGTASEYETLIRHVQEKVKEKFNVELETEVKILGEPL